MKENLAAIKSHKPIFMSEKYAFKSAVCIALIDNKEDFDIVFEVRSTNIPDQPGDVCLPGGAIEKGETYKQAAIREVCEELLVIPEQLTILGATDILHNRNLIIYPYVGILSDYKDTFHTDEVSEVFRVPLSFFLQTQPERHYVDVVMQPEEGFPYHLIQGGRNYQWRTSKTEELFYQYEGHVIWGLTARIIREFCEIIKE